MPICPIRLTILENFLSIRQPATPDCVGLPSASRHHPRTNLLGGKSCRVLSVLFQVAIEYEHSESHAKSVDLPNGPVGRWNTALKGVPCKRSLPIAKIGPAHRDRSPTTNGTEGINPQPANRTRRRGIDENGRLACKSATRTSIVKDWIDVVGCVAYIRREWIRDIFE